MMLFESMQIYKQKNLTITYLSILIISLIGVNASIVKANQDPILDSVNFNYINDTLVISYNLNGKKKGFYEVGLAVTGKNNNQYIPSHLFGEINTVQPGNNKTIYWLVREDYPKLNDSLSITVSASNNLRPNLFKTLAISTVLPGYTLKKPLGQIYGVATYSVFLGSLFYHNMAKNTYSIYLNEKDPIRGNELYNDLEKYKRTSNYLLYAGVTSMFINYMLVIMDQNSKVRSLQTKLPHVGITSDRHNNNYLTLNYNYRF